MNNKQRLEKWLAAQSNDWLSGHGASMRSTDNPGWWVEIDIRGTSLDAVGFQALRVGIIVDSKELEDRNKAQGETWHVSKLSDGSIYAMRQGDWIDCAIRDGKFVGAGDLGKLDAILGVFLDWAEKT